MSNTTKAKPESVSDRQASLFDNYLLLFVRICLSAIFIWSGTNKIIDPTAAQANMSAHGMPFTAFFLAGAIALELLGGFSVLLGIKPRWGAAMLIVFLVPATLIFHTNLATEIEQAMLLKNLAMLGGLLILMRDGGGNLALLN
ncbi:MAG: DoxX family protein [Cyanobacteria bacterium J06600_6]